MPVNPTNRTRREFLKTTAGVAVAGIAAPYVFTGAMAGAAEAKNDKLGVAAIGVGGRGSEIGRQAARQGAMVACADVHLGNAQGFAKKIGGNCAVYQDYRKVLERRDVEAVLIGTPDHWHVRIALDALAAGKDVYCEKPLTLTIDESRIICRAAKASDRVFQVGTQQRSDCNRAFLEAVAIARSGWLGEKLKAKASVGGGTSGGPFETEKPPAELNWDFWLGQAPEVPFCPNRIGWNFRWWFDYSGGQVTDWGVHHTDIALWALGGETAETVEIEGRGEFPIERQRILAYLLGQRPAASLPNRYNVARSFDCTITLSNGNTINLNSVGNDLFLAGEKGRLAVNRKGLRGKFVERLKENAADRDRLDAAVAKLYGGRPIHGHMAHFFDCVKNRWLPVSDVFSHCRSVNVCHAANIAMLLGRKVKFDLEKQEFPGDDEANRLSRRKQREAYAIPA
jgi:myo-inositol 2-dehydrogenase / D-chiro-inositol 1-dehydrogenase